MLTFEQVISIFSSFPELKRNNMANDRISFEYPMSRRRGYILAHELHKAENGYNGYICGKYLEPTTDYDFYQDGAISIKDIDEDRLRTLIIKAIISMS